jgi:hypothetical protein
MHTFRELVAPAQARDDAMKSRVSRRYHEKRGYPVPPWQTPEERAAVDAFVIACPPGMTIEHVAPRAHPEVVGMHVIENLAYMTPEANGAKSNQLPVDLTPAEAVRRGMAIWRKHLRADGTVDWSHYSEDTPN